MFKNWSLFEKLWLTTFTLINIYLFFAWDDTLIGLISSLSGMLCVVLVAKGKISNYYFGIIQTATYAYISFGYGLYGEAMLNGLFYFPLQFVGIWLWSKNKAKSSVKGEDIVVESLTKKGWIKTILIVPVAIIAYALFLKGIGGNSVWIDSATNVLSVTAQIFMLKRLTEQWLMWILVNVLSITLWLNALLITGGNDWSMLVMWTAFLANSVWAWFNWKKIYNKQEEVSK